jgi:hypothetical protein
MCRGSGRRRILDDAAAPGLGKHEGGTVAGGQVDSAPLGVAGFKEEPKKRVVGWPSAAARTERRASGSRR